jgi:hypothetical protein
MGHWGTSVWMLAAVLMLPATAVAGTVFQVVPASGSVMGGTRIQVFGVALFRPEDRLAVSVTIGVRGSSCTLVHDMTSPSLVTCITTPWEPMVPDSGAVTVRAPDRINHCGGGGSTCSFTFATGAPRLLSVSVALTARMFVCDGCACRPFPWLWTVYT